MSLNPKKRRAASSEMDFAHKRQRDLDAAERNDALGEYLSKMIPGDKPEQQLSFDRIQELVKPDTIYVDNDADDDIDPYEREAAEIDNVNIMNNIEAVEAKMKARFAKIRGAVSKPLATATPPVTPRVWNPLLTSEFELSEEEQRNVESCAMFSSMARAQALWAQTEFEQIHHFKNTAQQLFNAALGSDSTIQGNNCCFVTWIARDEELLASPIPKLRIVCKLERTHELFWKFVSSWLLPADVIVDINKK